MIRLGELLASKEPQSRPHLTLVCEREAAIELILACELMIDAHIVLIEIVAPLGSCEGVEVRECGGAQRDLNIRLWNIWQNLADEGINSAGRNHVAWKWLSGCGVEHIHALTRRRVNLAKR